LAVGGFFEGLKKNKPIETFKGGPGSGRGQRRPTQKRQGGVISQQGGKKRALGEGDGGSGTIKGGRGWGGKGGVPSYWQAKRFQLGGDDRIKTKSGGGVRKSPSKAKNRKGCMKNDNQGGPVFTEKEKRQKGGKNASRWP